MTRTRNSVFSCVLRVLPVLAQGTVQQALILPELTVSSVIY